MNSIRVFVVLVLLGLLNSCGPDEEQTPVPGSEISLKIRHLSLGDTLLQGKPVQDSSGTILSILKYQYYISGIRLENDNPMNTYRESGSYHLIKGLDNAGESELKLTGIPALPFKTLVLQIGIDSITNHKPGGEGDLNPGLGMYWPWSNEYKFLVLEGNFQYPDTSGSFLFHIAGDKCFRTIRIPVSDSSGNGIVLKSGSSISLNVELSALFGAPQPVNFRTFNNVMSYESGAGKIADNYENAGFIRLFSISQP